jgi:hypothetical protein
MRILKCKQIKGGIFQNPIKKPQIYEDPVYKTALLSSI